MHSPTKDQTKRFASTVASQLGVSARTIRKARQGSQSAISRVLASRESFVLGETITMSEMRKPASLKPAPNGKAVYCTDGTIATNREKNRQGS